MTKSYHMANQATCFPVGALTARPAQLFAGRTVDIYNGASSSSATCQYSNFVNNNNSWKEPVAKELFINSVFKDNPDFALSYAYLQQCISSHPAFGLVAIPPHSIFVNTQQQQQTLMTLSTMFRTTGYPLLGEERTSPTTTCKRTSSELRIEPHKLGNKPIQKKRARSCTMVEPPEDLDLDSSDGYDTELSYSSPSLTPLVEATAESVSPREPTSKLSSDHILDRALESTKSPRKFKNGLDGERRLSIKFHNAGTLMDPIQTFGKFGLIIRNGLCGTHTMYTQPWRFEINQVGNSNSQGEARLRWSVTNTASDTRVTFVETKDQAHERQVKGNTICNMVVREALNKRALELEKELALLDPNTSAARVAHLKSLVKELRPKQCTEGLLFFGLRHQVAQNRAG